MASDDDDDEDEEEEAEAEEETDKGVADMLRPSSWCRREPLSRLWVKQEQEPKSLLWKWDICWEGCFLCPVFDLEIIEKLFFFTKAWFFCFAFWYLMDLTTQIWTKDMYPTKK